MTKKILAGVLAAASILSVSASAFAASASPYAEGVSTATVSAPGETSYKVSAGLLACELSVVVPTTVKAFLNPYKSEVQVADASSAAAPGDKITTGVTSYAYIVENLSLTAAVGIDIVGGVAEGKGDVEVLTAADAKKLQEATAMPDGTDDEKTAKAAALAKYAGKKAFAVLAAGATSEIAFGTRDTGWANGAQQAAVTAAKVPVAQATFVEEDSEATATKNGVFVFTEDEKTLENFIKLPVASADTKSQVAAFTFAGLCENSKDASGEKEDWTNKDGLALNFAFKVHP